MGDPFALTTLSIAIVRSSQPSTIDWIGVFDREKSEFTNFFVTGSMGFSICIVSRGWCITSVSQLCLVGYCLHVVLYCRSDGRHWLWFYLHIQYCCRLLSDSKSASRKLMSLVDCRISFSRFSVYDIFCKFAGILKERIWASGCSRSYSALYGFSTFRLRKIGF